jgi:hypothetical protein
MSETLFKSLRCAAIAALALALSCNLITTSLGSPLDELADAVTRGGAGSAKEASPAQFLRAYTAVLVRAKPKEVIWYVNAAVRIRPDLAPKIVVVTLNARRPNMKISDKSEVWKQITDIIQAAVMASPEAAAAIVKAAVAAEPWARDGIVAAAIAVAPDERIAFLQAARDGQSARVGGFGLEGSYVFIPAIGTINPADYTRNENVNSPEQPPSLR